MTWLLAILGLALIGLGFWLAPRAKEKTDPGLPAEPSKEEAWNILGQPLYRAEEMARTREQENRHFQQGVLVGLGIGLLVASGVTLARPSAPVPVAQKPPAQTPPAQVPPTQAPPAPANVTFSVEPGADAPSIAASLQTAGLIQDPAAFLSRVAERGLDTSLRAGTFVIPTGAGLDEVIDALTS